VACPQKQSKRSDLCYAACWRLRAINLEASSAVSRSFRPRSTYYGATPTGQNRSACCLPSVLIFTELAQKFPDLAKGVALDGVPDAAAEQSAGQTNSLAKLRQRVIGQHREADNQRRRSGTINVVLGAVAAALAAGAGISGVSGFPKVVIGILALVSAATSTILITLKPSETAEVAKETAEALADLSSEIEQFETSAHTSEEARDAEIEAHNRLQAANPPRGASLR